MDMQHGPEKRAAFDSALPGEARIVQQRTAFFVALFLAQLVVDKLGPSKADFTRNERAAWGQKRTYPNVQ